MMGWPFLHPDFLRWTVDMYFQKKKKKKEEETAAARSGEENMNKSKQLGREDPKIKSGEEGGEGEEGEANKRMEPRLEHPGKQRTRTGTSGWWRPWTGTPGVEATLDSSDGAA